MRKNKRFWILLILLGLTAVVTLVSCATEQEFTYLFGDELQYSLDQRAWEKKYGKDRADDKEYKPFPYVEAEKEK